MKVSLEQYEDGSYFLRGFTDTYTTADYVVPPECLNNENYTVEIVDVPEHVVAAYATLMAQFATMQTLLARLSRDGYYERRRAQRKGETA